MAEEQPSIVVLPFDDISPGHDNEYLAGGLTEEIIGKLSQIRALMVISRTSAMTFKGTRKALRTIAEEVKVRYVLEGSVRRAGKSLRISAQLIDAASDTHLWADQYPGTLDDVFDMQEKVSRAIVEGLRLKLTPAEERQIARRPITDVQAYDAYLRARNALMRSTEEGTNEALRLLQDGLKLTGDNVLLYAGLGYVYFPYLSEYDPFLAKLHSDPRFRRLMVRVKGEWERFEPQENPSIGRIAKCPTLEVQAIRARHSSRPNHADFGSGSLALGIPRAWQRALHVSF